MDEEAGLTTPNIAEAQTNRVLVEAARKVVVVADHTKIGTVALARMVALNRVDAVITDEGCTEEQRSRLQSCGPEVIVPTP